MKNLKNYEVKELDSREINMINGGVWGFIAGAVFTVIIEDWDNFKAGLAGDPPIAN